MPPILREGFCVSESLQYENDCAQEEYKDTHQEDGAGETAVASLFLSQEETSQPAPSLSTLPHVTQGTTEATTKRRQRATSTSCLNEQLRLPVSANHRDGTEGFSLRSGEGASYCQIRAHLASLLLTSTFFRSFRRSVWKSPRCLVAALPCVSVAKTATLRPG